METRERKLVCTQCKVPSLYLKNDKGELRLVYVMDDGSVVARKLGETTDDFDTYIVYCLDCPWSGSPKRLMKGKDVCWRNVFITRRREKATPFPIAAIV